MIDKLLKRPMLHGYLTGIVGLTVGQFLWALPGWAGFFAVLVWAVIVSCYVARSD